MSISAAAAAYRMQYAISPIIMSGGIASSISGGLLPVLTLANQLLNSGLMVPDNTDDIEDFFAWFQPLPGGTLIDQQIGTYPYANQQIAGNATIQEPLNISLIMFCPAGKAAGYASKTVIMQAMQAAFKQHNVSGGMYTIMTPAYVYQNCVMTAMTDISSPMTKQVQMEYKLDFFQPLLTLQDAVAAQNALMNQISSGTATDGAQTGPAIGDPTGATASTSMPNTSSQGAPGIGSGPPDWNPSAGGGLTPSIGEAEAPAP
jgi:hypothetical protein